MIALHRTAMLVLISLCSAVPVMAAPAPRPNTHTITVNGQTKTYANLPGAPVGGDVGAAYQFRTRISTAPQCEGFIKDADTTFLNGSMPDDQKASALKAIESAAQTAQCLKP